MKGFIKVAIKSKGEVIIFLHAIAYIEDAGDKGCRIYVNSFRGELDTILYCTSPFSEIEGLIKNASN